MPTYEYKCPDCGIKFELFKPMLSPDADCPICGNRAKRLISAGGGLLFKGSGFYETDYRSKEYKAKTKSQKS